MASPTGLLGAILAPRPFGAAVAALRRSKLLSRHLPVARPSGALQATRFPPGESVPAVLSTVLPGAERDALQRARGAAPGRRASTLRVRLPEEAKQRKKPGTWPGLFLCMASPTGLRRAILPAAPSGRRRCAPAFKTAPCSFVEPYGFSSLGRLCRAPMRPRTSTRTSATRTSPIGTGRFRGRVADNLAAVRASAGIGRQFRRARSWTRSAAGRAGTMDSCASTLRVRLAERRSKKTKQREKPGTWPGSLLCMASPTGLRALSLARAPAGSSSLSLRRSDSLPANRSNPLRVLIPSRPGKQKGPAEARPFCLHGVPNGIRTRVATLKGWCPRPTRRWGRKLTFRRRGYAAEKPPSRRA